MQRWMPSSLPKMDSLAGILKPWRLCLLFSWVGLLLSFPVFSIPPFQEVPTSGPIRIVPLLQEITTKHEQILKATAKVDAARHRSREALGKWFPSLDLTTKIGSERQLKEGASDSSLHYREMDIKLSQLIWDFGKTNGKLQKEAYALKKAETLLDATRIRLILLAAKAILEIAKNRETLELAKKAENNILKVTQLEKYRVEEGAGVVTDLLQAKAQYAGAETRRIRAEGALVKAENSFRKLFKQAPVGVLSLNGLEEHLAGFLPKSLADAIQTAKETNTDIRSSRIDFLMAQETLRKTRGENYFPAITFAMEHKWKDNVAGVEGRKNESTAEFELKLPFNLGLTAIDTVQAARKDWIASENQLMDAYNNTEEEVRNAWQEQITLHAIAKTLDRQAEISKGFLELARQERQLGNRSLLDVLSGETSLINALSDAVAAKIDVLVGTVSLLKATGQLNVDLFVIKEHP